MRDVAALPDPVGEVVRGYTLPNGLQVRQIRVPLGVVGMIYEARPNVTVDAAVLALKSGNVALLRGSSSAYDSNTVLVEVMREALDSAGLPVDAIALVPGTSHDSVKHLMTARGLVDVLIPRGGAGLIQSVVEGSTVPVIETGVGNCHVYVDEHADLDEGGRDPRQRQDAARERLQRRRDLPRAPGGRRRVPAAGARRAARTRASRCTATSGWRRTPRAAGIAFAPVTDDDWAAEYYSLDIAAGVVDDLDEALTAHPPLVVGPHRGDRVATRRRAIQTFITGVDSAAVMVNASTRFTDGGEFGFGAEIGISTQKLHARGPMGLAELTSTTYVVTGDGHVRRLSRAGSRIGTRAAGRSGRCRPGPVAIARPTRTRAVGVAPCDRGVEGTGMSASQHSRRRSPTSPARPRRCPRKWVFGGIALVVLLLLLFIITRFNIDR